MSVTRALGGLAGVLALSCTFPDVTFEGGAGGGAGASGTGSQSIGSTTGSMSGSTGSTGNCEGGGWQGECDNDTDGWPDPACCGDLSKQDCDDTNDDVFPGQPGWFTVARANGTFDYDCSDSNEPEFTFAQCGTVDCIQNPLATHYSPNTDPIPCGQTVYQTYCDGNMICQQNNTMFTLACH